MEQGDVQRQCLGKVDRLPDGCFRFAGQTDDEVAPVHDAGLLRPAQRAFRLIGIGTFAGMLEDLLVAALDAPRDQAAAGLAHQLQHFLIDEVDAAVACPMDVDLFIDHQLAQLDHLIAVDREQVGIHVDIIDAELLQIPHFFHDQLRVSAGAWNTGS